MYRRPLSAKRDEMTVISKAEQKQNYITAYLTDNVVTPSTNCVISSHFRIFILGIKKKQKNE